MEANLGDNWERWLAGELNQPYFESLREFVMSERASHDVFPSETDVFRAFRLTEAENVSVVILGQDPYHNHGQAHGLAFSVPAGVRLPPSLRNIFKELSADVGCETPAAGNLEHWAGQGVLLLNTVLTVRAHEPHSHRRMGWEKFTDAIVTELNNRLDKLVFVLWGKPAQAKLPMIDCDRHLAICSAHPSPLSAHRGFFGSRPFTQINEWRAEQGLSPIKWC